MNRTVRVETVPAALAAPVDDHPLSAARLAAFYDEFALIASRVARVLDAVADGGATGAQEARREAQRARDLASDAVDTARRVRHIGVVEEPTAMATERVRWPSGRFRVGRGDRLPPRWPATQPAVPALAVRGGSGDRREPGS